MLIAIALGPSFLHVISLGANNDGQLSLTTFLIETAGVGHNISAMNACVCMIPERHLALTLRHSEVI